MQKLEFGVTDSFVLIKEVWESHKCCCWECGSKQEKDLENDIHGFRCFRCGNFEGRHKGRRKNFFQFPIFYFFRVSALLVSFTLHNYVFDVETSH